LREIARSGKHGHVCALRHPGAPDRLPQLFLVGVARIRDSRDSRTGGVGPRVRDAGARHAAKHDTGSRKPPTCADITDATGVSGGAGDAARDAARGTIWQ